MEKSPVKETRQVASHSDSSLKQQFVPVQPTPWQSRPETRSPPPRRADTESPLFIPDRPPRLRSVVVDHKKTSTSSTTEEGELTGRPRPLTKKKKPKKRNAADKDRRKFRRYRERMYGFIALAHDRLQYRYDVLAIAGDFQAFYDTVEGARNAIRQYL